MLAACFCLAALPLAAQNRTLPGNSKGASSASGKSSSAKAQNEKSIFELVTSPDSAAKAGMTAAPAVGRTSTAASPFGTTSNRTKTSTARRWKTTSKIADCLREKTIPSNTNFSFSGSITNIMTDGRYTILTMFESVSIKTESGVTADIPVKFTVVLNAETAGNASIKAGTRKSFTVDSNYVYFVWDESGCTVRVIDNSLTEPDQTNSKKR